MGHEVILASFSRPEEEQFLPSLYQVCADVYPIRIHRSRVADIGYWLRSLLSGRPFLIERDDMTAMRKCIKEILSDNQIDCIHADQLTMAQFAFEYPISQARPTLVFDAHNAVWTVVERMAHNVPWYLKPILGLEARRVKNYEGMLVSRFDHILAVTEIDKRLLIEASETVREGRHSGERQEGKSSITVTPIAVDTELLQPVNRRLGSKNLFTLGTLHYPPNADGIRWFAQEVFPLIQREEPEVKLTIAGRNPPQDFLRMADASQGSIQVTGYVPQLMPYLEESAVMVVPVRAGSGMRVRILEAFAQAMPVVTTTTGLEGIDAIHGEEVMVADTPPDFANSVIALLQDEPLQARLAANGRRLAECCYDWKVILQKMNGIYESK